MNYRRQLHLFVAAGLTVALLGCAPESAPVLENVTVFSGARIIDGTGNAAIENATLVVKDGRIEAVGEHGSVQVPEGAQSVDVSGKTIVPGFINAHGHVGSTQGMQSGPDYYSRENVLDQLGLYARYGVTTVVSLGNDEEEAVAVRDAQNSSGLDRARIYIAGPVLTPQTPEEAREDVDEVAAMKVDWGQDTCRRQSWVNKENASRGLSGGHRSGPQERVKGSSSHVLPGRRKGSSSRRCGLPGPQRAGPGSG